MITGERGAPEAESTLVVLGHDERAVATVMALLREFRWSAASARFPGWTDEALAATIASGDRPALRALVRRRFRDDARWLVRAPASDETFAGMASLLHDARYVAVVDDALVTGETQAVAAEGGDPAWLAGLPQWLASEIRAGAPMLAIGAAAAVERSAELVDVLGTFVEEHDADRREVAVSWTRLFQSYPDLPFSTFKVTGTIGQATTQGGGGWAYIEAVEAPVDLEVRVNGRSFVVPASNPRPDLRERGFHPTGNCGFHFTFPSDFVVSAGDLIHIRVIGDSRELINSPAQAQQYDPNVAIVRPPSRILGEIVKAPVEETPIELPDLPRHKPRSAIVVFLNTFWALLLREMRARFGTQRGDYVWGLLEPTAQIVILTLLIRGIKGKFEGKIYGEDAVYFFSLGILPYQMFAEAVSGSRVKAGSGLFNFRQIQPMDVGLVNAFFEFLLYGVIMVLMLAIANWFGYDYTIDQPLQFLYCLFLLFWLGFSLGLFFDVLANFFPAARFILSVLMKMLFVTSGVFYSVASLPPAAQPYLLWNPLLNIIEAVRASGMESYPLRGNLEYATACTVVALFFALAFYRRNLYRLF